MEAFTLMASTTDEGEEGGGGNGGVRPPMVISLAKKEELVFVQDRTEPIRLGRNNAGLRLLQSIRDEAHRFAQHYHHVLRRKKTVGE
jgi:excinuclease ABC subunit C